MSLRYNIASLEDLLKLNNIYHLIRNFSNLSQFYLSLVNLFSIHMKRVSAFLYYTASFILVIAIAFCQSNLFWDCASGFDGNRNLREQMKKSKPGSNGSKNNPILVFLFLTSSFFHLQTKTKT